MILFLYLIQHIKLLFPNKLNGENLKYKMLFKNSNINLLVSKTKLIRNKSQNLTRRINRSNPIQTSISLCIKVEEGSDTGKSLIINVSASVSEWLFLGFTYIILIGQKDSGVVIEQERLSSCGL